MLFLIYLQVTIEQLYQEIKQSGECMETSARQQAAFEKFVTAKLEDITGTLDELMFLAPLSSTLPGGNSSLPDGTRATLEGPQSTTPVSQQSFTCTTPLMPKQPVPYQHSTDTSGKLSHDIELSKVSNFSNLQTAAIRSKSCSRRNYATNLARELFSAEERSTCNVSGVCGKGKLDVKWMEVIKISNFEMLPLNNAENNHKA